MGMFGAKFVPKREPEKLDLGTCITQFSKGSMGLIARVMVS